MRLMISESKNSKSLYAIKSTFENGKHSSKIVEKLGTIQELERKLDGQSPIQWAREYIAHLNEDEKKERNEVIVKYSNSKCIAKGVQSNYHGGYLFLQSIYHDLGIDDICAKIALKHSFSYDLDSILSRLIYGRILHPSSKLATSHFSETLLERKNFDDHQVYRALEILADENDFIQSELYKNSGRVTKRKDAILYYDCTNYYFEIEQEKGLKRYGYSKEHRPNPIVEMGLFMDADGIPLAFSIHPGNINEQVTLKPLEQKIIKDFGHAKFVVVTDAGLASCANRKFNDSASRAFITTQSVKQLKGHLKTWALDIHGWHLPCDTRTYNLDDIDEKACYSKVYYKERWIKENELEQRLIVTFSLKYRNYQRTIRNQQIERAQSLIERMPWSINRASQNSARRLIKQIAVTDEGEIADKHVCTLDEEVITREEAYDGFYGVCTNLEDDAEAIIRVNKGRWEIEECFRIIKHEFKARPVYLSRDKRIEAHFITCFIALMIYRLLEKRLGDKYTSIEIIDGLRSLDFYKVKGEGYIPAYTRTDFTDDLHNMFGFRTDYQIVTNKQMGDIFRKTKQ